MMQKQATWHEAKGKSKVSSVDPVMTGLGARAALRVPARRPLRFTGNLTDIDLRLLRVFRAVVRSGGLSRAEHVLGAGKSTISRHIADLEARLGIRLCRRGRSGFALTAEGERVYSAVLQLFASLDEFKARINATHSRLDGMLSIAFGDSAILNNPVATIPAIAAFRAAAPDVHLQLATAGESEIERGLLDGTHQLGLVWGSRDGANFDCRSVLVQRSLLFCGKDHPFFGMADDAIAHSSIVDAPFAMLAANQAELDFVATCHLRAVATARDVDSISALILTGQYLGFLPQHYASYFQTQGLIRPVLAGKLSYRTMIVAVTRKGAVLSPVTEQFLHELQRRALEAAVDMSGSSERSVGKEV
jgi:DNA-binding transcriptional LysR family regulator